MWQVYSPADRLELGKAREWECMVIGSDGTYTKDSSSMYTTAEINVNITSQVRQTEGRLEPPIQAADRLWRLHLSTRCNVRLSSDSDMSDAPVTSSPEEMGLVIVV